MKCQIVQEPEPRGNNWLSLEGLDESGVEIRRIILLTRLRESANGMTMKQLVRDCSRVPGWSFAGQSLWDEVRSVLQSLIDNRLVASRTRFVLTEKGREYLADPLKWRVEVQTKEHVEENMFWKNILSVFDKAYSKLRASTQSLTTASGQGKKDPGSA